jgi:hypothetical protein
MREVKTPVSPKTSGLCVVVPRCGIDFHAAHVTFGDTGQGLLCIL